jgi:hypothetical protein
LPTRGWSFSPPTSKSSGRGSCWGGKLKVVKTGNADVPMTTGMKPLSSLFRLFWPPTFAGVTMWA